jgi:mono/diheme cytochrome c family protein
MRAHLRVAVARLSDLLYDRGQGGQAMRYWGAAILLLAACQQQAKPAAKAAEVTFAGGDYRNGADKVAHGKRLAVILDCTGCHGSNLQGTNLADKPENGAMYAPNITLLLGKYSDAELDKLIRHGAPKDGREFWFMPVESYQFLSDADAAALIAYLRTVKPGGNPLPPFAFNAVEHKDVEQGLLGNAQAQIRKYRDHPPVDLGPRHAWGRYMVQTTCTMCHNNALQGWPNFTPNLDIAGAYSKTELTRLLATGEGKTGKDVGMSGIARAHFSQLTPHEREAVVDYLLARANRPQ